MAAAGTGTARGCYIPQIRLPRWPRGGPRQRGMRHASAVGRPQPRPPGAWGRGHRIAHIAGETDAAHRAVEVPQVAVARRCDDHCGSSHCGCYVLESRHGCGRRGGRLAAGGPPMRMAGRENGAPRRCCTAILCFGREIWGCVPRAVAAQCSWVAARRGGGLVRSGRGVKCAPAPGRRGAGPRPGPGAPQPSPRRPQADGSWQRCAPSAPCVRAIAAHAGNRHPSQATEAAESSERQLGQLKGCTYGAAAAQMKRMPVRSRGPASRRRITKGDHTAHALACMQCHPAGRVHTLSVVNASPRAART